MSALLEEELVYKDYKVLPEDRIKIFEGIDEPEKISGLAASNNIGLLALEEKSVNLENYYMSLIGSIQHDLFNFI